MSGKRTKILRAEFREIESTSPFPRPRSVFDVIRVLRGKDIVPRGRFRILQREDERGRPGWREFKRRWNNRSKQI